MNKEKYILVVLLLIAIASSIILYIDRFFGIDDILITMKYFLVAVVYLILFSLKLLYEKMKKDSLVNTQVVYRQRIVKDILELGSYGWLVSSLLIIYFYNWKFIIAVFIISYILSRLIMISLIEKRVFITLSSYILRRV